MNTSLQVSCIYLFMIIDKNISLLVEFDGVPFFVKSKVSMYPIVGILRKLLTN